MDPAVSNPLYNIRRTVADAPLPGGGTEKVITAVTIETALTLVVTQDAGSAGAQGRLFLPPTASVRIVADDLTIEGSLSFPGRDVAIFARVLRARAGTAPPSISVDGVPPEIRPTQKAPPLRERPPQVDVGTKGPHGENDTVVGPGGGSTRRDGGTGWSGPDHAAAMNGRDGTAGTDREGLLDANGALVDRRGDAGSIFVCCDRAEFPPGIVLALSANGGAGELGQPGQDGAVGGPGGDGFDGVIRVGGISFSDPTRGGNGGRGGAGGRGGDSGKGGRGGSLAVYCASGHPAVACSVAGGASQPGKGGRGGKGGDPGHGGNGFWFSPAFRNYREWIDDAKGGERGPDGTEGRDGESRPGTPGKAMVRGGPLPAEALANLVSLSQLQMMFEAARADYLVTPMPPPRPLQLVAVAADSALPDRRDPHTVEVAMVGTALQVRLFASDGRPELVWTDVATRSAAADAIRQFFTALPLRLLLAADWAPPGPAVTLSVQDRAVLLQRYGELTSEPKTELHKAGDDDLVGRAAVALALLGSGLHDRAWLASKSSDYQRNELISACSQRTSRSVGELQGMGNRALASVALEWSAWPADAVASDALVQQILDVLPPQLLLAFDWMGPGRTFALGESQRTALAGLLASRSNQPVGDFLALSDSELAGATAVTTLLLGADLRDAAALATLGADGHRNALIDELAKRVGRDVGVLQGMTNLRLVCEGIGLLDWRTWLARLRSLDGWAERCDAMRQRFAIAPGVVLRSDWTASPGDGALSAAERTALIEQLAAMTAIPADYARRLPDQALAGWRAVAGLLSAAGIRNGTALKSLSGSGMLLALNEANLARSHRRAEDGQVMRIEEQLNLAQGWFDWPAKLQDDLAEDERQDLVAQACALAGYNDPWSSIGERLGWVSHLAVSLANDGSDPNRRKLAAALRDATYPPLERFGRGFDYFGKGATFAPGLSFGSYDTAMAEAIGDETKYFPTIEKYYRQYFGKLGKQEDTQASLGEALNNYGAQQMFVKNNASGNDDEIRQTLAGIDEADGKVRATRDDLVKRLAMFETQAKAAFGLSVETLFNCLSQLSFVNASEPIHAVETITKVGGTASAGAMAVGQLGAMINEAANSVIDDFGKPAHKELLLRQVKLIERDIDLRSQFTQLADDYISTDQSKRLLVELEKFRELCDQFRKSLDGAAVAKDVDQYIETITRRNQYIDRYNALFRQRAELRGELRRLEIQEQAVGAQLTQGEDPGLPAMTTYVSGLYERAKADVLSLLYMAHRAHAFWALQPADGFHAVFGGNPQAIGSLQLQGARHALRTLIRQGFEATQNPPKPFPPDDNTPGRIVVLTRTAHLLLFEDLASGSMDFELLPATKDLPAPVSDYEPTRSVIRLGDEIPEDADTLPNPFYAMANVRLSKVRVWMVGMSTGNARHRVDLVHKGKERFRTQADTAYPLPEDNLPAYVRHTARPITFAYDATGLHYDRVRRKLTPGSLHASTPGLEDGDLKLQVDRGAELPLQCELAPIGPFGHWQLSVDPAYNGGSKLSFRHLDMIVIEFHGLYQGFSR